ncbi:hypothetical protein ACS8Y6_05845 [Salinisphaera sp. RV14]|uniref:hypothetical protein n=1 Tax=unclassified Salinisphaera TaxID=2649847 RepID=UPI003F87C934
MADNLNIADNYRRSNIAGLTTQEVFLRGLHGVVVHIRRATLVADDVEKKPIKLQHLANADRLLTFMVGMADDRTDLGSTLIECYTEIQNRVALAIQSTTDEAARAIDGALQEAMALESDIRTTLEGVEHGQPA